MGCPKCFYTGYRGRQAAFEVLPITWALTDRITSGAGDIQAYMQQTGLPLLRDTLAEWLQQGLISLEEAIGHLEGYEDQV